MGSDEKSAKLAKSAKSANSTKRGKGPAKVSIFHLLLVLVGANLLMLLTPEVGMLHSFLYLPDIYSWSGLVMGVGLLFTGFHGLYKNL
ncbi:MAG: hypothetical protein FDX02_00630 [Chlorobium sp.]|nr:MAG: hypothetical protein FDX02_00630 [Chlorobium sp.]